MFPMKQVLSQRQGGPKSPLEGIMGRGPASGPQREWWSQDSNLLLLECENRTSAQQQDI